MDKTMFSQFVNIFYLNMAPVHSAEAIKYTDCISAPSINVLDMTLNHLMERPQS